MPRLFVAAWPPDDVLDRVAALPRPDVEALRWTDRSQWHVTLRFLGNVDDLDAVGAALGALAVPATNAVLGPVVERFGQRVLHVPVDGLEAVAADVVRVTAHLGRPPDERPFHGHLTLARAKGRRRVDLRPLVGQPVSGSWPVDEVCLVESRLHAHGSRYDVIDRIQLRNGRTMT